MIIARHVCSKVLHTGIAAHISAAGSPPSDWYNIGAVQENIKTPSVKCKLVAMLNYQPLKHVPIHYVLEPILFT